MDNAITQAIHIIDALIKANTALETRVEGLVHINEILYKQLSRCNSSPQSSSLPSYSKCNQFDCNRHAVIAGYCLECASKIPSLRVPR